MFVALPDHRLKRVSIEKVERRAYENENHLESLGVAHERFLQRAARVLSETQPYVLRYVTEAILENDDDSELDLTDDESGLLFLVLKTVVELLDEALVPRR